MASEAADPLRIDAWRWLLRAHSIVVQAIERDLRAADLLPLHWYDVLLELNSAPDRRLRMVELGERVVLSRSRSSRVVDELEHLGLVQRVPDPADGRASFAQITPKGRGALRRSAPTYLDGIEEHFTHHLSTEEREVMAGALRRIVEAHTESAAP